MYASLIATGVTSLFDLFKSQTQPTSTASTFDPAAKDKATTAVGTGTSGGLSTSLNSLLLDLQSSRTAGTDQTQAVASDLKDVVHEGRVFGHGHHGAKPATGSDTANPFQSLASSLLAYTKAQGTAAGTSGGLALSA